MHHKIIMKYLLLFIIIHFACLTYAQNDTLYLEANHLLLNNKEINKSNTKGEKYGEWIEYDIDLFKVNRNIDEICASGDGFHSYSTIYNKFRALKGNEYDGILIETELSVDTIDGVLYYGGTYNKIMNRVPKDFYFIEGRGYYKDDKKDGEWKYYYKSGHLKKSIIYSLGIPILSYKIFREDGTLMMFITKYDKTNWCAQKYSPEGIKFETIIRPLKMFEILY